MLVKKAENITAGKQYGGTRFNLKIRQFCEICVESRCFVLSVHHIAYQQNVSGDCYDSVFKDIPLSHDTFQFETTNSHQKNLKNHIAHFLVGVHNHLFLI